jgi:hypothetical protein
LPKFELPVFSGQEFSELLGVAPSSVSEWISQGMPASNAGRNGRQVRIDLWKALPWVMSRREPSGSQRERLAKAQAEKFELDNARRRGELIMSNHVAEVLSTMAADLVARMEAIPGRCAGEFAGINEPARIRARLLDELRTVRGAFAGAVDQLADSIGTATDDSSDSDAPGGQDADAVGGRKPRASGRKRRAGTVSQQ